MKTNSFLFLLLATACLAMWAPSPTLAASLDNSFTYQGQLNDANGPANGNYDFSFRLFRTANTASLAYGPITNVAVAVADGRFTTSLNFGTNVFDGTAYWLRIDVRTNTTNVAASFVTLTPRQMLTATPYAFYAPQAGFADNAGSASGVSPNAITAASITNGTITANKIAASEVVKSINGLQDDVSLQAGANITLTTNAAIRRLTVSAGPFSVRNQTNIYYNDGNLGVGTNAPAEKLHVIGDILASGQVISDYRFLSDAGTNTAAAYAFNGDGDTGIFRPANNALALTTSGSERLRVTGAGRVGIGTGTPDASLEIQATGRSNAVLRLTSSSNVVNSVTPASVLELMDDAASGWAVEKDIAGHFNIHEGTAFNAPHRLSIRKDTGHVGIGDYADNSQYASRVLAIAGDPNAAQFPGTAAVVLKGAPGGAWSIGTYTDGNLHITKDGSDTDEEVVVPILKVVGGSDIAEPFNISTDLEVRPGMVVSIDPERTGELRVSCRAYDSTVAGIVSGAGGVKTGMTLTQDGTAASGKRPVALTGRVYCFVDADAGGPVVPGDLLTTSETPGHAMKVTDRERAGGATLGKAMSSLKHGKGLVLVLVTLQ